jgi:beta-phosphoglucomutase
MAMFVPKALLFDLDGLVVDSESGYRAAWQAAACGLGYSLDAIPWHRLTGASSQQVRSILQTYSGDSFDFAEFQRLSSLEWQCLVQRQGIPVKPGFHALLALIRRRGLPFALVTNSPRHAALRVLDYAGLSGVFPQMVCGDEVAHAKPAPDAYRVAAQRLDTPIGDCWVLEDSLTGVLAAHAAGARCLYIPSHYPPDTDALGKAFALYADLQQVAEALSL